MTLFEQLKREAEYALRSLSRDLVFETYGKAKMAVGLQAITMDQFLELNKMLITDGVNNYRNIKLK